MDSIKESRDNTTKQLQSAVDSAAEFLDDGLASATHAAKQSVAIVRLNAEEAMEVGQSYWDTGVAHFQHGRERVFDKIKEGVRTAEEHQEITWPALTIALTLTLPPTRRFLWRQTLGRFRSEESLYRSAEGRYAALSESLEGATAEGEKLAQRLAAAEEQYDTGLRKLTATAKQIAALQRQVRGSQKAGDRLTADLRELPSREALALRAQAAAKAAAARAQAGSLESTLWRLAKKGVY